MLKRVLSTKMIDIIDASIVKLEYNEKEQIFNINDSGLTENQYGYRTLCECLSVESAGKLILFLTEQFNSEKFGLQNKRISYRTLKRTVDNLNQYLYSNILEIS